MTDQTQAANLIVVDVRDRIFYWNPEILAWFSSFQSVNSEGKSEIQLLFLILQTNNQCHPSGFLRGIETTTWKPLGTLPGGIRVWMPKWQSLNTRKMVDTRYRLLSHAATYPSFEGWIKEGIYDPNIRQRIPEKTFTNAKSLGLQIPGYTIKEIKPMTEDKVALPTTFRGATIEEMIPEGPLSDEHESLIQKKVADSILYKPGVTMSQVEAAREVDKSQKAAKEAYEKHVGSPWPEQKSPGHLSGGAELGRAGSVTPQSIMSLMDIPYYSLVAVSEQLQEAEHGKYGRLNWKKGVGDPEFQRKRNANAIRHLMLWSNGDRSENHLAKVAWFALIQLELERLEELNKDSRQMAIDYNER